MYEKKLAENLQVGDSILVGARNSDKPIYPAVVSSIMPVVTQGNELMKLYLYPADEWRGEEGIPIPFVCRKKQETVVMVDSTEWFKASVKS